MNVEQILNDYLSKKKLLSAKDHAEFTGLINASSLGQCLRRIYYNIEKFTPTNPPDERLQRVFACGDLFHDFVQQILTKSEIGLPEQSFKNDDVYEFKSMHSHAFWYMQKEIDAGLSIVDMKPDHVLQVVLGALCFKKQIANLVYISKDDLCLKQFTLNVKELEPMVTKEITLIKEMLHSGNLPLPQPRLYGDKIDKDLKCPKECAYCNWREMCQTDEENRQELTGEEIDAVEYLIGER
jgi:hypothetical protein